LAKDRNINCLTGGGVQTKKNEQRESRKRKESDQSAESNGTKDERHHGEN